MATITPRERTEWRVTCAARPKQNRVFKHQPAAAAYAEQLLVQEQLPAHAVRITEHTETVWLVRVRCKGAPDVSKTFERQSDAKDWARKIEGDIAQRQFVDHRKADHTTLAEIQKRYEKDRLAHRHKGHPDRTRVRRLAGLPLACRPLSSLMPSDFVNFRDDRSKKVRGATVRKDLEMFSRVIAIAMREWEIYLPLNPASGKYYLWPELQPGDARDRRLKLAHSATPEPLESGKREAKRQSPAKTKEGKNRTPWVIEPWVVVWMQMLQTEEQAILRACRYPNWFQPKKPNAKSASVRERAWHAGRNRNKYRQRGGMRLWAYVSLALETGLRRGELGCCQNFGHRPKLPEHELCLAAEDLSLARWVAMHCIGCSPLDGLPSSARPAKTRSRTDGVLSWVNSALQQLQKAKVSHRAALRDSACGHEQSPNTVAVLAGHCVSRSNRHPCAADCQIQSSRNAASMAV